MISQTSSFLLLRWLAVLLLSLLWTMMGSATSLAERGDFGQSSNAAKGGVQILEQEGNVIIGSFKVAGGEARVATEIVRDGDTLILRGTHIEGQGTLKEALEAAKQFGREQGAKKIIIEGGAQTTGANPGRVPRPVTVETGL
jgi:hypothetical protein